jgi:DNA-binding NarL/FixJ family response regulator
MLVLSATGLFYINVRWEESPVKGGNMIKILLVDDETEIRQGWQMRLALETDITVVGEAANAETALLQAEATQPDVVLLDIKMPGQDGLSLIGPLHQVAPACQIIIVTIYDSPDRRRLAHEAGAAAFIAKQEPPEHLLTTIREVSPAPPEF